MVLVLLLYYAHARGVRHPHCLVVAVWISEGCHVVTLSHDVVVSMSKGSLSSCSCFCSRRLAPSKSLGRQLGFLHSTF